MSTYLGEALLTATGAAPLVAKAVDPVIIEYTRRFAPLVRALPSKKWDSPVYYFNKRTVLPQGGFVTDGGARPLSNSTYVQENFQMKNLQSVGAVTGYAEAVTAQTIGSLRGREIEGAAKGLLWDIETALLFGANAPTVTGPYPQFDGLDVICASYSSASSGGPGQGIGGGSIDNYAGASGVTGWGYPTFTPWVDGIDLNAIDAAGAGLTLGQLDLLLDMVEQNTAESIEGTDYMFVLSTSAVSRIAQLLQHQQRFEEKATVAPGFTVNTYRGVPLVKTSFLAPRTNVMGTVVATGANAGGTLSNGTYSYRVAPVISRFGEIQASAHAEGTTTGTGIVTLTFSTPSGPDGGTPTHYKVYRAPVGTTTGHTLLGFVDAAFTNGGVTYATTTIIDTGSALQLKNTSSGLTPTIGQPSVYYYTNANVKPKTSAGEQDIYLLSRDENNILRPYVRDIKPVELAATTASPDSLPFAFVSDTCLAVRAAKFIGRLSNVVTAIDTSSGGPYVITQGASGAYTPTPVVD